MPPVTNSAIDWPACRAALDARGWAVLPRLLDAETCADLIAAYDDEHAFRKRIVMARHGYGQGEYQYFAYPLPPAVATLRTELYAELAPLANFWAPALGVAEPFPPDHETFLARCHQAGQTRPTPLLLRYGPGDYNCLHQDLYGATAFPLQATVLLSAPGDAFTGGEFVLVEQRPRMQSRPTVVALALGDAVLFATNQRPIRGSRGTYRVAMRHGVSPLATGARHTLGVIFHDAS